MNSIVYDLEQGAYNIEVRANEDCPIKSKAMTLPFVAQDKTVNIFGIYVHILNYYILIGILTNPCVDMKSYRR